MEEAVNEKEVYFVKYCRRCKHRNLPETKEPCNECLTSPSNIDSHKPIKFEEGVIRNG